MASSFLRFLDHTQRRTTVGRTPRNELSARRRDLYLTTHNTHNRQTSMPPVGFEPTISASERPQTYALDRTATGTGKVSISFVIYVCLSARNNSTPAWRILAKFEYFSQICRENSTLIKIRQGYLHMTICAHLWKYFVELGLFLEGEIFETKAVRKFKTHILCSINFFSRKSCILWDNEEQ